MTLSHDEALLVALCAELNEQALTSVPRETTTRHKERASARREERCNNCERDDER
jgi:hypothetical protein